MASHPFTHVVVHEMRRLFPEELADRTWDNVGLLLENSRQPTSATESQRVLLTNDLTPDVVEEAIAYNVTVIVAYHPIIFRGLKSITLQDPQQASLLKLMQNNIAVYSPHTALDAGHFGINDWLADTVSTVAKSLGATTPSTTVIKSVRDRMPPSYLALDREGKPLDVGYGRRIQFNHTLPAAEVIRRAVRELGLSMSHVLVARPRIQQAKSASLTDLDDIHSVGVCAGSGFDIFRDQINKFSMLITGEVSHHDALYATTRGVWVVCLLHSNSERKFLSARLQGELMKQITQYTDFKDAVVLVSERDRDPFEIWDLDNPPTQRTSDRPEAFTV
ncbi:ngg1 interacting factor [Sporothrix brasiliensis 5110]|uniref:Ngg1 interacting factor n=1 Tax=Sporothrix brasiliensis 5110 TaxID=1398154 RepID=A0A0C2FD49_9PEZI|nr:ngg1 interacting factor [Sporothrix brasiliensis 5110]KIH89063.1 ngg1 interacting factor [Sporothrix brasiliensis 5110]